jgi:putative adhesin
MKGAKIGLLLVILAFGSTVETAWRVRNRLGAGAWGWFMMGGKFHGPSFTFIADQTETVAADTPVQVENGFGGVKIVQGAPGEVRIALRKVVFLATEEKARAYADRIRVQALREGSTLRIVTNRAELERAASSAEPEVGFETHLDLVVPPGTAVKVSNEHGAIDVADVARADLSGSFDTVRAFRVAGPAEIQARHGDVHASGVKGDLKLTSRHGDATLEDVGGRATVDVQHGEVSATRTGSLSVTSAHGDVTAETVNGDFEVHAQHGAVRGTDVTGRASVETSFQGVTLERVGGDATAHTEHGDIALTDVKGAVDAQASYDDVTLTRIGGPATVVVRHGAVRAHGLEKGARVRASGDEVVLEDFQGPLDVETERSAVRLVPAGAITAVVKVRAMHGGIELEVPAGSRFDLHASAEHGQITADVPGLSATQMSTGRLAGKLGGGGSVVDLSTQHGDVRLHGVAEVAQKTP